MASTIKARVSTEAGITTVKALIRHPMETGRRTDPETGQTVPAHYIQELTCEHNGETVITAYWGTGVSRNPYFSFRFAGARAGDKLTLAWLDNRGQRDSLTVPIP